MNRESALFVLLGVGFILAGPVFVWLLYLVVMP